MLLLQQVKEFIIKYRNVIGIIILLTIFFIGLSILFFDNNGLRRIEKQTKTEIEQLHKENKSLLKDKQILLDSVKILHDLAINTNNQDTIYINQIKVIKTKTNEEFNHLHTLNRDSTYILFSDLLSEYSKNRFSKDSF